MMKHEETGEHIFIIAEAGVNHNGDIRIAKQLVDVAVASGADAVKFQTFVSEKCIAIGADKAKYQKRVSGENESQLDMVKKLELKFDDFRELKLYCEHKGILFLSTAFDIDSAWFLRDIGLDIFKIPSGEITNYPLLKTIGQFGKKVIMSTGMSKILEIRNAMEVLRRFGTTDIALLHCNTQYPTPMKDVNLLAMEQLKQEFHAPVGYSDHTLGIEVPIAAAALGAVIIEKHFTLNRNMDGPDHRASLEPEELKNMVTAIRNIEEALGDGKKKITVSERENITAARKSIVAARPIKQGTIFTEENLTAKRPGCGISPMMWEEILGRAANRDYEMDELIEL